MYHRWSHGRVYVRGLPPEWSWLDTMNWVSETLALPEPSYVYMHPKRPRADVVSAYVHWVKPTHGQLTTYAEHMNNKWLTHRATEAVVSQDYFFSEEKKRPMPYDPPASWPKGENAVVSPW